VISDVWFKKCFALIVSKNVLLQIKVGFMMVGHTHDLVDQVFSIISQYHHKHTHVIDRYLCFTFAECFPF
jgi:hypothetical protein